ncbi:MAG: hypothetical protein AVO33_09140 [delta proteobacterium ML8_F1]|nr:MAG: hypothetical protein AVO33_09140 [delta proteobacterium ML8_F1]
MAQLIVMPKLGLTMKEGKLVKWNKQVGDTINLGEKIFVAETDKLTNDVEATQAGTLLKILQEEGSTVKVLEPLGIVGREGEDISQLLAGLDSDSGKEVKVKETAAPQAAKPQIPGKPEGKIKASPKAKKLAEARGVDLSLVQGTGPAGSITEKDVEGYEPPSQKVKMSPTAANVAKTLGVDPGTMEASGRLMKEDVVAHWNRQSLEELIQPLETRTPMSSMRRVIAERMRESLETSAVVHYNLSVDTTEMTRLREKLKPVYKVTYTDLIVKIVSAALMANPLLNASVEGEEIITRNYVNMGVAVALEEGLIVPNIKFSQAKGLKTISQEIQELSGKARAGTLTLDEMTGGTFTVTNLGMFNMESFTPIINQPEVAILGINSIMEVPAKVDGELVFKPMMTLSLSADHRVVDGSEGAKFLNLVKSYMENPSILML